MTNNPVLQVAAKAIILNQAGQVLMLRESAAHNTNTQVGKYQFPGGRLEPGEAFLDGLRREALEETGIAVTPVRPLHVGEWRPVVLGVPHQIVAIFMLCTAASDTVILSEEHDAYMWVDVSNRQDCNAMAPDDDILDDYLATAQV